MLAFRFLWIPESKDQYLKAIDLSGEWFINNQSDEFLYYQYNPEENMWPDSHHALRESGALWSISKLYRFTGEKKYERLTKKGLKYFEDYFEYDEDHDFYYVGITPGEVKLGYSAFMILTLLEVEDYPGREFYLEKFANGILRQQQKDGSFKTYFYSDEVESEDYYPGEALFALMALYEEKGDIRYLRATEKAFPYYRDYWQGNKNTAFVPWQTRAYRRLFDETQRQDVSEFVFEMNDYILFQHGSSCSGFDFSRGSVSAVYMEGVIEAYRLAGSVDDVHRKECYRNFIKEGADAVIGLQIQKQGNYDAKQVVGGFCGSKKDTTQRADRNQHATVALIEAYELGLLN